VFCATLRRHDPSCQIITKITVIIIDIIANNQPACRNTNFFIAHLPVFSGPLLQEHNLITVTVVGAGFQYPSGVISLSERASP
jgi:hypothetical protein